MSQAPPLRGAPVVFDELAFSADVKRASAAGANAARIARDRYEKEGVPTARLLLCAVEGEDGTSLPECLKVYLPEPIGRFGMVFQLETDPIGSRLNYLAFGVRHHPRGSHAPTVYQLAHQRLHGISRTPPRR
jgi:hypothetical protein